MTTSTTQEIADAVVAQLEQRGVPAGAWLVDIAQVRSSLREADDLLRRMGEALIRHAGGNDV